MRYQNTPRAAQFDLSRESDQQLLDRLASPNVFYRDLAQRLLAERDDSQTRGKLESMVLDDAEPHKTRMHALWALVGTQRLDTGFHATLLDHGDSALRAWGVRAAGNFGVVDQSLRDKIISMATDRSRDVQLQVAIAAGKIEGIDPLAVLVEVLAHCGDDKLIPHIVWQNLHPLLDQQAAQFLALVKKYDLKATPSLANIMPRVTERIVASKAVLPK